MWCVLLRRRSFGYRPATAFTPRVAPPMAPQTTAQRPRATAFGAIIQMSRCQDCQNETSPNFFLRALRP